MKDHGDVKNMEEEKKQEAAAQEEEIKEAEVKEPEAKEPEAQTETVKEDAQSAAEGETAEPAKEAAAEDTDREPEAETAEESSDESTDEEDTGEAEPGKEKGKGIFGKIRKEKKDPRDQKIEELTDRYTRLMAEFENFRKRTEKEKAAMFEVGAKSIVEKILPVVDNFERGLAAVPEDEKQDAFTEGMQKVYKQFITSLEEAGVTPIEAVGKEFDPELHNAVMHIEDENFGENTVAEEFQKGYRYRDSVVRHSMVKVAN